MFSKLLNASWMKWLAILILAYFLFLQSFSEVISNDFWWHLALGKWMIQTSSFLKTDIFSYTFEGQPWLNSTWLFDIVLYKVYSWGSYWGLNIFRFVIFSATYFFLYKASRLKNSAAISIIALLLLTVPLIRFFLRPEMVFALYLAFFLWALFSYKYKQTKYIYLLPLVEILWVNTHGSFTTGPVLIGIFTASELWPALLQSRHNILKVFHASKLLKTYIIITLAVLAATIINPYGYTIYIWLYNILADRESLINIVEWKPQSFNAFLGFTLTRLTASSVLLWATIVLIIRKVIRHIRRLQKPVKILKALPYEDMLLISFFLVSALHYIRLNYILTIVLVIIFARYLPEFFRRRVIALTLLIISIGFIMIVKYNSPHNFKILSGPAPFRYPVHTVAYLLENQFEGPLFNDYGAGGYLIWHLYPDYQLYIDGRTPNLYDNNFYWNFRLLDTNNNILEHTLTENNPKVAILSNKTPIARVLASREDWGIIFFDDISQLLLKRTEDNADFFDKHVYTLLNPNTPEEQYLEFCKNDEEREKLLLEIERHGIEFADNLFGKLIKTDLILECGNKDQLAEAEQLMQQSHERRPDNPLYLYKLGVIKNELDEYDAAIDYFERSLKLSKQAVTMTGLAIARYNNGEYEAAAKIFKNIPYKLGPPPPEYYQIYGRTLYQLDDNAKSIEMLQRYLLLIDEEDIIGQDYRDLSNAYLDNGELEKSAEYAALVNEFSRHEE